MSAKPKLCWFSQTRKAFSDIVQIFVFCCIFIPFFLFTLLRVAVDGQELMGIYQLCKCWTNSCCKYKYWELILHQPPTSASQTPKRSHLPHQCNARNDKNKHNVKTCIFLISMCLSMNRRMHQYIHSNLHMYTHTYTSVDLQWLWKNLFISEITQ